MWRLTLGMNLRTAHRSSKGRLIITFFKGAIVATQMTLGRKHPSIPSGVLSTNWLIFHWTVAVASNHSCWLIRSWHKHYETYRTHVYLFNVNSNNNNNDNNNNESIQPTMNSITKTAAKIAEELSQPNEKSDAKQEGIQHTKGKTGRGFNPLKPELNPICYLLALLGAHHFLRVSRIRVKSLTFRRLMSYTYGAPILDVSRSHTTTQHSR